MDCNIQFGLNLSSTFTILFQKSMLLKKKKYMQSPRHICQDQQYRNENEWDQPEELCLLKLFLFSKSVESRTQSCTKSRLTGYDLFLLFIPAQSFIVTFPLFVFLHLQNTDRFNITKINVFCKTEWPLFTLAGMGSLGISD